MARSPRPSVAPQPQPSQPVSPPVPVASLPLEPTSSLSPKKPRRRLLIAVSSIVGIIIAAIVAGLIWYASQLSPLKEGSTVKKTVLIQPGTTPQQIGTILKEQEIIRNESAFGIYFRVSGMTGSLQAGRHVLSPSMDVPTIVGELSKAEPDEITLTFLPGSTVKDNEKVLINAGYSQDEVDAAFSRQYDHPVFQDKPASADIEGYIYGETYNFPINASVEQILTRTFDELYKVIGQNNLVAGYQAQGLTLYEGITLASIIQRESGGDDKTQIAQIFLLRKQQGMVLGSDVTYQYIADKTGVQRDINLDSPYNTRRYPGLPPGPIAAPGLDALRAVASPSDTDYLYFLSGDDDVTYYGRTLDEHEANIRDHCNRKCQII